MRKVDAQIKGTLYKTVHSRHMLLEQQLTLDASEIIMRKCKYDGGSYKLFFLNGKKGTLKVIISRASLLRISRICSKEFNSWVGCQNQKGIRTRGEKRENAMMGRTTKKEEILG